MARAHPTRHPFSGLHPDHPLARRGFWIGVAAAAVAALALWGLHGLIGVAVLVLFFAVVSWPVKRAAPAAQATRVEDWIGYPDWDQPPAPRARARVEWDVVSGEVLEPAEPVVLEPARRQIGGGA